MGAAVVNPAATGLVPPCPFLAVTGCWCPGCGTLRGLHQLFTGNLAAAVSYNPLMVLALVLLAGTVLASWARALGLLRGPPRSVPVALPWIAFAVIVGFGILRNIPTTPFSALAP